VSPLTVQVPGAEALVIEHVVLDINGTLTDRGRLIAGVESRVRALAHELSLHLATADTFGGAAEVAARLTVELHRVADGEDKRLLVERLGPAATAAIGNGRNDVPMLRAAALGIAVVGPEGASGPALQAADLVAGSILDALDMLADARALQATLRR